MSACSARVDRSAKGTLAMAKGRAKRLAVDFELRPEGLLTGDEPNVEGRLGADLEGEEPVFELHAE